MLNVHSRIWVMLMFKSFFCNFALIHFFLCIVQIRLLQCSSHGHSQLCYSTDAESLRYCCTPYSQSSTPSKLHTCPTVTPLAPSFWTNKIQNYLHVLQRNHRFRPLLSVWATAHLQSFPLSPLLVRHTHAQTATLQPQKHPQLSHFLTFRPPHLEQSPPRHQALCKSLFLQTQDISLLRISPLSNTVHHLNQSV